MDRLASLRATLEPMSTLRPPLWLQLARGRSLIPLLLLCIPLSSKAESPNAKPAGSTAVQSSAMEPFHVIEDIVYLQPGRDEKMDLYLPARGPGDSPAPAVIWVHGNGSNKASGRIRDECLTFTSAGYICASIDWTLDTPFRVLPILDCKNAVRFLRVHAKEYHIDPSRIAIGGGSGGGYLASMVGFTAGEVGFEPPEPYPGVSSAVGAVIDFYGGYDGRRFPLVQRQLAVLPLDMAGVRPALTQIDLFQPVNHLASSVPPVLIVQGREDPLIDYHQAIEMDRDLTAKGVPHELVLMDHVGHAFTFTTDGDHLLPRDLRPIVLAFLGKYLGTADRSPQTTGHAQ